MLSVYYLWSDSERNTKTEGREEFFVEARVASEGEGASARL